MRKRVIGAGAVVLVAVGIWLGNILQGPGLGEAETDSSDTNGETVQVSLSTDVDPASTTPDTGDGTAADTEDPDVLTLLVDDDQYQIQRGEDWYAEFSPATLEDIISKAGDVPGDENGVRVRLRFRENAQNGAISDLKSALTDAGLEPESIIEDAEYVE